jgi:hypothetical protein
MQYWTHPKTQKSLHGFLGITGYYMKIVKDYGKIVSPLTSQLENNSFVWNQVIEHAFLDLKDTMCMTSILVVPNFSNIFLLECDASSRGLGVVFM